MIKQSWKNVYFVLIKKKPNETNNTHTHTFQSVNYYVNVMSIFLESIQSFQTDRVKFFFYLATHSSDLIFFLFFLIRRNLIIFSRQNVWLSITRFYNKRQQLYHNVSLKISRFDSCGLWISPNQCRPYIFSAK